MPLPGLRSVGCFLLGFWLAISAGADGLAPLSGPEARALERINRVRREHHLSELHAAPELARVAQSHALELARSGQLAHVNARGQNPLERVQAAGIDGFRLLAENIGASSGDGDPLEAVVREWLRSPVHRENLLNPAFNTTGIAVVDYGQGGALFVQLFATF